jgi:hypothetical protein
MEENAIVKKYADQIVQDIYGKFTSHEESMNYGVVCYLVQRAVDDVKDIIINRVAKGNYLTGQDVVNIIKDE